MASPATENWWSTFLDAQGRDSEEEAAFNGYLTTQKISAESGPDVLQTAYTEFRTFMEESYDREADPGPDRGELAKQQAVAELEQQFVAKSRVSAPGVEKPRTAVTRPAETREPLAESAPGPEGAAQLGSATHPTTGTDPATGETPHPQVHASADAASPGGQTPTATGPEHREPQEHRERRGTHGRGTSGDT